jgi:hypothetical protein
MKLEWKDLDQRVRGVFYAVRGASEDWRSVVDLVRTASYHVGAAGVALELIDNVEDPDRRRALAQLFTAPQDLLDWTAGSLGVRSVISSLDLCAAALWRLGGGQPQRDGWESDIEHAYRHRSQLASGPLVDWLARVRDSRDYSVNKQFRDGFTHRQVNRRVSVLLGPPTVFRFESEVGTSTQTTVAHLRLAAPFAVEQFSAFCDAVQQFKRS